MQIIKSSLFTGDFTWQALDIAQISDASIRLHWADQPYIWHKNDGDEVFVV
ncbi:TPA: cupin, partial [Legionella pneumophila]|nr:cupin [Legionella pneumophila]HAU1562197.1 cupin [Legionella pneumophila]